MSDYSQHTNYKLRLAISGAACVALLLWGVGNLIAGMWVSGVIVVLLGLGAGILADTSLRMLRIQRRG